MANRRKRKLWTKITAKVPLGVSVRDFWTTLRQGIESKSYGVPVGANVKIEWRNKEGASMKSGEYGKEMRASAESSVGFDKAILSYIDKQIERTEWKAERQGPKSKTEARDGVRRKRRVKRRKGKGRNGRKSTRKGRKIVRGRGKVRKAVRGRRQRKTRKRGRK
jgi:hypothetical protein